VGDLSDELRTPSGAWLSGCGEARAPFVFLDLETTGLSGGAGTVAFLAGCAWFDLGALQVRQFLLPGFAAERGLLNAVAELVQPAALIVTYNGRAFDVPLMETRWLFHRLESPFADKRHFDMLHPARRLWRRRARADVAADSQEGGCSLGALERALLDVQRVGDVPGWEIPSRYFQFLRTGEPRLLEAVLEHNRLDLVSLAAVVARAVSLVEGGAEVCADEHESLALGKLFDRAGRTSAAEACYRRASIDGDAPVRAEALVRLALRCRREQRHREAVEAWNAILDLRGAEMPVTLARRVALEALAIHHEHRAHDFNAAREFAVAALDADERPRWRHDVRHRLARLDRKLAGTRTQGPSASAPLLRDDLQSE
jgi:uncharacterized protein YprB with RNaseH-like and TPR domain